MTRSARDCFILFAHLSGVKEHALHGPSTLMAWRSVLVGPLDAWQHDHDKTTISGQEPSGQKCSEAQRKLGT